MTGWRLFVPGSGIKVPLARHDVQPSVSPLLSSSWLARRIRRFHRRMSRPCGPNVLERSSATTGQPGQRPADTQQPPCPHRALDWLVLPWGTAGIQSVSSPDSPLMGGLSDLLAKA